MVGETPQLTFCSCQINEICVIYDFVKSVRRLKRVRGLRNLPNSATLRNSLASCLQAVPGMLLFLLIARVALVFMPCIHSVNANAKTQQLNTSSFSIFYVEALDVFHVAPN